MTQTATGIYVEEKAHTVRAVPRNMLNAEHGANGPTIDL